MFLSALHCVLRRTFVVALAGALTITGCAQTSAQPDQSPPQGPQPQRFVTKDYSKPQSYFPNPLAPYRSQSVAPPNLSNTPRIEQLLQNGKLMLSMNDAVALARKQSARVTAAIRQ